MGIFTEPEEKVAGEGPIFTAEGDVVENRCYFVRVPGEGILYFDPQNPDTTACVHAQGAAADVSPAAVSGRGAPENCQRGPLGRLWCSPVGGLLRQGDLKEAYEASYLPH